MVLVALQELIEIDFAITNTTAELDVRDALSMRTRPGCQRGGTEAKVLRRLLAGQELIREDRGTAFFHGYLHVCEEPHDPKYNAAYRLKNHFVFFP